MIKKRSSEELLQEFTELKSVMAAAKKMLKTGYHEEINRQLEFEKVLKANLKDTSPITLGDLSLGLLAVNREMRGLINLHHMTQLQIVDEKQKIMEAHMAVNVILSILDDFARESKLKNIQRKVAKIQKFQDKIIRDVKQKAERKATARPTYIE